MHNKLLTIRVYGNALCTTEDHKGKKSKRSRKKVKMNLSASELRTRYFALT